MTELINLLIVILFDFLFKFTSLLQPISVVPVFKDMSCLHKGTIQNSVSYPGGCLEKTMCHNTWASGPGAPKDMD